MVDLCIDLCIYLYIYIYIICLYIYLHNYVYYDRLKLFLYNVKMTTNIITHEIQDDLGYPILKQAYSVSEVIVPILVQLFSEIDGTAVNLFV